MGLWIQSIGQIMEALGVSKETSSIDHKSILDAHAGDLLQSAGAAIEATGGIEILSEGGREIIP